MSQIVDTAALAAHLGCTPAHVRRLTKQRIIPTLGRRLLGRTGRPSLWYDTDAVDDALETHRQQRLDADRIKVRKS